MGKKKTKETKDEPRKLLCSRGQLFSPKPAPKLDEHGHPVNGDDPDESPYENDD